MEKYGTITETTTVLKLPEETIEKIVEWRKLKSM